MSTRLFDNSGDGGYLRRTRLSVCPGSTLKLPLKAFFLLPSSLVMSQSAGETWTSAASGARGEVGQHHLAKGAPHLGWWLPRSLPSGLLGATLLNAGTLGWLGGSDVLGVLQADGFCWWSVPRKHGYGFEWISSPGTLFGGISFGW